MKQRRKIFRSKAVSCKLGWNTESVILRFFCCPGGTLETQELFPEAYFTHETMYAHLSLFMGSFNMQEHLDSDLFWSDVG